MLLYQKLAIIVKLHDDNTKALYSDPYNDKDIDYKIQIELAKQQITTLMQMYFPTGTEFKFGASYEERLVFSIPFLNKYRYKAEVVPSLYSLYRLTLKNAEGVSATNDVFRFVNNILQKETE